MVAQNQSGYGVRTRSFSKPKTNCFQPMNALIVAFLYIVFALTAISATAGIVLCLAWDRHEKASYDEVVESNSTIMVPLPYLICATYKFSILVGMLIGFSLAGVSALNTFEPQGALSAFTLRIALCAFGGAITGGVIGGLTRFTINQIKAQDSYSS